MGQPVAVTKALATAASDTAVCLSQSPGAAGKLTINGVHASGGVATLDSQRKIIVTSGGDDSAKTFTITGTNQYGAPIKDAFLGANGIAQSNLDFLTVTQVYISAASAGTVKVGTNGVGSSPWVLFNSHIPTPNISLSAVLNSGTATIQVEYTYDEIITSPVGTGPAIAYAPANTVPLAILHPSLQNLSANSDGGLNFPFRGWRFTILSGTGSWTVTGTQAGISGP